jgi:hypothetical protein
MDYYPYEILEDSPMTHPAIAEAARNLICGEGLYDYDATDLERATSIITAAVERVCGERDADLRDAAKLIERLCYRLRRMPTSDKNQAMAAIQLLEQSTQWLGVKGLQGSPLREVEDDR